MDSSFVKLLRSLVFAAILIVADLCGSGLAQERLSLPDVEALLSGEVAPRRIAELIKEHGINFELTDELRDRFKRAGAGPAIMQPLEGASIRFRLARDAERVKTGGSKKELPASEEQQKPTTRVDPAVDKDVSKRIEPEKRVDPKPTPPIVAEQKPDSSEKSQQQKVITLPLQLQEKADHVVGLENLTIRDGEVSGRLVNHSSQSIFGIQLQVLYSWRWNNDFRPGADDPGRADTFTIDREILPKQSLPFHYTPSPPLPVRKDGSFEITVKVIGFTKIFR
jgi:hypothetical protein